MNNRVDVKIAILGEEGSGKEMFGKMLFLDNNTKIRIDPLSKIAEIYMEIDPINFKNGSKKIVEECNKQNNLIMKQMQFKNISDLRNSNIEPFFYRCTPRIRGIIDYDDK